MAQISPDTLDARLRADGEGPLVLDIRPADEFAEWHVPGSTNVDVYDELTNEPTEAVDALANLPSEQEIVTVCAAGVVSQTATDVLTEHGYEAVTLEDGLAGWSRVHRSAVVPTDTDWTVIQVARPGKGCLSYIVESASEAVVIDPSTYLDEYVAILDERGAELVAVADTHAHADHVSGGRDLADRHDVPYYLHPADAIAVDAEPLGDGDTLTVGDSVIEVIHTPGHSPGGVSYAVDDEVLLTGDTLFHESVGRVELGVEAGLEETDVRDNAERLYESLRRLLSRDGDPYVLPAHDPGTPAPPVASRMSAVRDRNADLGLDRRAFVESLAEDVPDHPPNFQRVKRVNVGTETVAADEVSELEAGPNRCAAE